MRYIDFLSKQKLEMKMMGEEDRNTLSIAFPDKSYTDPALHKAVLLDMDVGYGYLEVEDLKRLKSLLDITISILENEFN